MAGTVQHRLNVKAQVASVGVTLTVSLGIPALFYTSSMSIGQLVTILAVLVAGFVFGGVAYFALEEMRAVARQTGSSQLLGRFLAWGGLLLAVALILFTSWLAYYVATSAIYLD